MKHSGSPHHFPRSGNEAGFDDYIVRQDLLLQTAPANSVHNHIAILVKPNRSDSSPAKLSVCIPTYNGAKYLGKAIASVLGQTLTDFELIIVDDCSTDDTEAVIKSFSDSRIKYFQNPARLGLVGNWNRCLGLSTGKYICIFHQDDVMLPENLERKIKILEENPGVGLVYSNVFIIDAKGDVTFENWYFKTEPDKDFIAPGLSFFETLVSGLNIISCPSVMVRRECYEKLGGFDSRLPLTADWEMWMRIALFYDIAYLVKPLVKYRWHGGNESVNFRGLRELEQYYQCKMIAIEKYPERIPNYRALESSVAKDYEKQALDRVLDHYRRQQYAEAKRYLAFALKVRSTTALEYSSNDKYIQWFREAVDEVWQGSQQPSHQIPIAQEVTNNLSGEEIAQQIPIRKLIKVVGFKIAAKLGFRWLYRFRDWRKKP